MTTRPEESHRAPDPEPAQLYAPKQGDASSQDATPQQDDAAPKSAALPAQAQAPIVYLVVFLAFMGQMLLNPIIAPLSREMHLQEWHIGATISLAAIVLMFLSPLWGKSAGRRGAKPVLALAMGLGAAALASFSAVAYLGMHGLWTGPGLVLGVMVTRGLFYGGSIAGVLPSSQTHLVKQTTTEAQRVKAVGGLGAVNALSGVVGGLLGGALAAAGGLLLPLYVMPLLLAAGLVVLLVAFHPAQSDRRPERRSVSLSYFDPRVFPFALAGLLMFITFASLTTLYGFLIQDRFSLSAQGTAGISAAYLAALSVSLIITQAVVVPKTGWNSVLLLRRGLLVATLGLIFLLPGASYTLLAVGTVLFGVGAGLAMPGYNAGPTMEMSKEEQGALAGLLSANNGAAYAIAPVASTALYGIHPLLPLVIVVIVTLLAAAMGYVHPKLRHLAKR